MQAAMRLITHFGPALAGSAAEYHSLFDAPMSADFMSLAMRLGARGIPKQIFLGAREAETGIDYVRAFIELARQPGS